MVTAKPKNIDEYIAGFPKDTQVILEKIRATIKEAAPEAEEAIRYAIPTFMLQGNLVHFAAFENHIGFYATPTGHEAFQKELSAYKRGKGSVQFPLDQPVPLHLIAKMVRFRVRENLEKAKTKKKATICPEGHTYYKSSSCPVCPRCEQERKAKEGFLSLLAAPARRALENKGITNLQQLSKYTEPEILALHGMGQRSLPILRSVLKEEGLTFKDDNQQKQQRKGV